MLTHRVMKDELDGIATSLLCNSELGDPLLYLSNMSSIALTAPSVLNQILYKLLLENDVSINIPNLSTFLQNLLTGFELEGPCEYNYKEAVLNPSSVFPDLWSILTHLINSSFAYHGIDFKSDLLLLPVQHPLCDLLLYFYVQYIMKFLSLKRDLFEDKYDERRKLLMKWINVFYKFNKEQVEILKELHCLLEKAINDNVISSNLFPSSLALNQTSLSQAVLEILTLCQDCFTSSDKVTTFLNHCKTEYISASLCYHFLMSLTKRKKSLTEKTPLTLKEMVHDFLFVRLSKNTESNPGKTYKEKVRKKHVEELTMGDEKLHTLCRKNMFADLLEYLTQAENVNLNIRNLAQQTPLHVASICSNFLIAKLLLDSSVGKTYREIDLAAVDSFSCTPLHFAVLANDIGIVRLLLKHGGEELLHKRDVYGLSPYDYVNSIEMKQTLEHFCPNIKLKSIDLKTETLEVSALECVDYSLYLSTLHSLLCHYFNLFHLNELKAGFDLVEHGELSCEHFVTCGSNTICVEDYSIVHLLPKCISEFIELVKSDAGNCAVENEVKLFHGFSFLCDILMASVSDSTKVYPMI